MVATRFLLIVVVAASASEKELPSPSIVSHQKQAKNKIFNYEWKLLKRRNQRHLSERRQQYPETQHEHADRRVMPWVSMMVLLIFLSLFRSFAAPFFDPLGEPRRATGSTIYFSFIAFLYLWLALVTTLTILPHVSTHYNVIIATALFFYMTTVSLSVLLIGRFIIRCGYYVWMFWKLGRCKKISLGHQIEKRPTTRISLRPKLLSIQRTNSTANDNSQSKQFPALFAFHRPFRRLFQCALLVSAALCILYAHCWSRSLSAFKVSSEEGASIVCRGVFLPMIILFGTSSDGSCHSSESCADERFIWNLWVCAIMGHLFYYAMHEFTGKHHKGYRPSSQSRQPIKKDVASSDDLVDVDVSKSSSSLDIDDDDNGNSEDHEEKGDATTHDRINTEKEKDQWISLPTSIKKFSKSKSERPNDTLPMVPWYNLMMFTSGFDILVSLHIFLGRFDARKMQVALLKEKAKEPARIDMNSTNSVDACDLMDSEEIFDFSQCNNDYHERNQKDDGFWFDFMSDCGDGFNSSFQVSRLLAQPVLNVTMTSSTSTRGETRLLPRGKLLVIGGDLAYPDPTPKSYEQRFFRTFEDAMPPPPLFRKAHISIRKPALPVNGWDLPVKTRETEQVEEEKKESPEICSRSSVNGVSNESLKSYEGPSVFAIPGNHDWFDGLATYTRYILSRDWLGGWLMPQKTSYFALKLPRGWWVLGLDLALDDDINIEQFSFFAKMADQSMQPNDTVIIVTHVPHWVLSEYENRSGESMPETNLRELMRTHLKGKVKLRLAGDLHHYTRHMPLKEERDIDGKLPPFDSRDECNAYDKPVLIVSGGGGAFLHPTHCFGEHIRVGGEQQEYQRVCAYPSAKVSRHLSWLNLWQFRWRNWRFDILWAVIYFGICSSFFPLCGVYGDYLKYNPTHHPGYLLAWVSSRVLILFTQIFISGRLSLLFTMLVIMLVYGFTDWSNLKLSTHFGWSLFHALSHIFTALVCLLFVECMAEFIVSEGLVSTQNGPDATNAQSCGTGLASSIYDEYTNHFSHVLDDFQLVNSTNSSIFHDPPNLFQSCRFDEHVYEKVSSTIRWMHDEAPLLKTTLAIFDLPGVIGSTHVELCEKLCSGDSYCTYSNDFIRYQQIDRVTVIKYLSAISFYFVVFAVPIAGNIFGIWLALTLNILNSQYNEGFSSLRLQHWKNFLRMHINEAGDLEIFSIGLHRVPKKWIKDPSWGGNDFRGKKKTTTPSWSWKRPSKWIPQPNSKNCMPVVVDYTKIKKSSSVNEQY